MSSPLTPELPKDLLQAYQPFVGRVSYRTLEFAQVLQKPHMIAFVFSNVLLYVFVDTLGLQNIVGFWPAVLYWVITLPVYFASWNLMAYLAARLQQKLGLGPIFLPFIGAAVFIVVALQGTLQIALYNGTSFAEAILPSFLLRGYLMTLTIEVLFFAVISPFLIRLYFPQWTNELDPERTLVIGDSTFALKDVLFLRSNKHFVEIGLLSGVVTPLRGRLVDLVGQTKPEDGIMAHRSYWIARHAISGLRVSRRGDEIELKTGECMSVAKPRTEEVRQWAKTFNVPVMDELARDAG